MAVGALHHAGRTVQAMDEVLPFYRDILGLKVVDDDVLEGEDISRMVGLENARLRAVMLSVDGDIPFAELIEYYSPSSRPLTGTALPSDVGNAHFCLLVDDIHAECERLSREGVRFTGPPIVAEAGVFVGEWSAYCYDPEGQIIELWARAR